MKAALLVIGLLCVLAFAPGTNASEQNGQATSTQEPPVFRRTVDMVLVDVIVTDEKGRAVPGLMQSDFVITEDGRRQSIESFEEFQTTDVEGEINFSGESSTSPTAAARFFTLVVDDIHITPHPPAILRARAAAAALVEAASDGDQMMLVSPGAGLITLESLPEGRPRLLELCEKIEGLWTVCNPAEMRRRKYWFLDNFGFAIEKTAEVEGPKGLVLISRGFNYVSQSLIKDSAEYHRLTDLSLLANAPIFFVNVGGLKSPIESDPSRPDSPYKDRGLSTYIGDDRNRFINIMDTLASDTGGFTIHNTNAPEKEMHRIVRESSVYYQLGYYPENKDADGKFRKIRVKVNRKGLKVRARKGYFAPLEEELPAK